MRFALTCINDDCASAFDSFENILVKDGLNVTIFSPLIDPHVNIVGHTSAARQIPYQSKYNNPDDWLQLDIKGSALWETPKMEGRSMSMDDWERFMAINRNVCKGVSEDVDILDTLRSYKFDVALHEAYELCAVAILELIGVKNTVVVSALGVTPYIQEVAGFPANPSFVPGMLTTYTDNMNFWERLGNFKIAIDMHKRLTAQERDIWKLANEARPGFSELRTLLKDKTGVVLMNVNEFTETPRPTANILRYIGGAAIYKPEKLNEKMNAILNERPMNVLFSLGSLAQSKDMPMRLKQDIIAAFASFPDATFIWKYEDENNSVLFKNYPNIHIMKWIPQMELLADKRLSLFITHAGMNSVLEAIFCGKPMVTIPLFVDQALNAKNMKRRAIRQTLPANSSYALKAAKVAKYLRGRPDAARAEIVRWVKLVAEEVQVEDSDGFA
ncbi:hypothetical protein RB195_017699 [Necator americanus]|uniref:UDP-glucuronosyltransferase n=1 Tax=Necator americanus TaxID=51031 RepID=A0ABR1C8Q6_NECAM